MTAPDYCDACPPLSEAVRILHRQAHNSPSDSLDAERCRREPCDTVAPYLESERPAPALFGAMAGER